MLDYYGSIMMSEWDISNNLSQTPKYKKYSKEYIYNVINYLYTRKIISDSYSYSGWRVFHKDNVCDKVDDYIKLDLLNRKKIVALMFQLTNSTDLVFEPDLYKKICDNIVIKYYG